MYVKGQRTSFDATTRKIDMIFYREKEIRRAVKNARLESAGGHTGGSSGHALVSDPTAVQGIKAATELKSVTLCDGVVVHHPEKWLNVIDATYARLDDWQRRAVKMRYQGEKYTEVGAKLHISKSTYYAMVNEAQTFAIAAACQLGLVRIV